jgi:colanic acid/amylovoran biosynthesis glycosyltransferase
MVKTSPNCRNSLEIAFMFYDRPNYCAGPTVNARRLLPELVKRGYQVTALIGYQKACPSREFLEKQGVAVCAVPWPALVEEQVQWLYRQLATIDPDIFVPNISVSGCYAARYLREAGRPTIAGHRSDDQLNWSMAERFCQKQDKWAVSALFCVSDALAQTVRQWQPRRTILKTIPSGVPLPHRVANLSGPLRLVFAGRLVRRQKRVSELITAMMESMARDPQLTAKIIGDGMERAAIERQIAVSAYADRFRVTGFVPPERLHDEMLDCNVFILLSDFEGVPGAVMDAMACGLIPVCLDIQGGLRELVIHQETGLLVTDREQSFQDAISRLTQDSALRKRLSANARKHIEDRFSLDVTADRWEQLFHEVLAATEPRRPIRFPPKPVLPRPYPGFAREDKRRPKWYARAFHKCVKLLQRGTR